MNQPLIGRYYAEGGVFSLLDNELGEHRRHGKDEFGHEG
jgi:hypothetical protein